MNMILLKYILSSINKTNSITEVQKRGYSFSQIGEALLNALSGGYLSLEGEKYTLTDKGKKVLLEQKPYTPFTLLDEYKLPEKLPLEQIYIPKYNKGDFEG